MNKKGASKLAWFAFVFACVLLIVVVVHRASCSADDRQTTDKPVMKTVYGDLGYTLIPDSIPSEILVYDGFTLSFNKKTRVANWVGWELLRSETDGEWSRSDRFWQDPEVEGCASTEDYRRSGYDRGHMCPAADQKWGEKPMNDCFVLTNIAPQAGALNRGAWQTLEQKTRMWAKRDSALVIVAGPIYGSDEIKTIGNGVRVPDAFFKVILAPYVDRPRAIGFVFPNMSAPGNMQNYVMTVDDIETITGFDFFSALPDETENEIEAVASFKEWMKRQ